MCILLRGFVLNELLTRHYTIEWVYSSTPYTGHDKDQIAEMHAHPDNSTRMAKRNCLIRMTYALGLIVLALTVVLVLWFYSGARQRGIPHAHGRLWRFIYQPDAVMPDNVVSGFTSQSLQVEEKFDLDHLVHAVVERLLALSSSQ